MKYFVMVLVFLLFATGVHAAKKRHMGDFNFDHFCPHDPASCNGWCVRFLFDLGKCEGPGNNQCWCYWYLKQPSLQGRSPIS
ncbi:uncharacterized protein LOC134705373 [Mytilus trossulus]|uniref:uncharacterized protein LOC134705373 n=1 Tax=Mytilus trossulus TaxID=6551 RepID=UPI003004F263